MPYDESLDPQERARRSTEFFAPLVPGQLGCVFDHSDRELLPRSVADGVSRSLCDGHQRGGFDWSRNEMAIASAVRFHRRAMAIWG